MTARPLAGTSRESFPRTGGLAPVEGTNELRESSISCCRGANELLESEEHHARSIPYVLNNEKDFRILWAAGNSAAERQIQKKQYDGSTDSWAGRLQRTCTYQLVFRTTE